MNRVTARQYCKLCDRRDFDDPRVLAQLREIAGVRLSEREELHRKLWEYAMFGIYLHDVGR